MKHDEKKYEERREPNDPKVHGAKGENRAYGEGGHKHTHPESRHHSGKPREMCPH